MENIEAINGLLVSAPLLVALATGLTEVVKRATNLDTRYLPAVSVLIGFITGIAILGVSIISGVVGIIAGLAGVGLFEFGRTTVKGE